jgi:hypothetical protein
MTSANSSKKDSFVQRPSRELPVSVLVPVLNNDVRDDRRAKESELVQQMLVTLERTDGCEPSVPNDVLSKNCVNQTN